ncbi:transcription factor IIIB 50 kDa subunit-like [Ornithodoros turicata]|uniref:transcription factor IIIB 50 kDa subunit-like n=1 Tax=Ornithodoros turicata TaxID=34597 RepID=UPI003139B228
MAGKCPDCGEEAVISGNDVPSGCNVCTACGAVTEYLDLRISNGGPCEGTHFVDASKEKNSTLLLSRNSRHGTRGVHRVDAQHKLHGPRREGLHWLQQMALHFKMDTHTKERAEATYLELVGKTGHKKLAYKTALAAACCYVVMRLEHWSVSLKELSKFVQRTVGEINTAVRFVQKETGAEFSRASSADILRTVLRRYDVDDAEKVLSRGKEVLKVAEMCWQGEGRSPQNMASAAIYIAWKSLDPSRASTNYKAFCHKVGIQESKPVHDLATAFVKVLVKLAQKIPWVTSEKVKASNVTIYLPDIVKHAVSLVLDCSAPQVPCKEDTTNLRDAAVYATFRASSSPKRARRDSATEECGSDFSDSEIERYIRTPEEVEAVKRHMASYGLLH